MSRRGSHIPKNSLVKGKNLPECLKIYFVNFRVNLAFHENMIPQETFIKLSPRYQNLVFVDKISSFLEHFYTKIIPHALFRLFVSKSLTGHKTKSV